MTRPAHPSVVREVVQALAEQGFDGMAQAMELLINECMKVERQQALGVGPYQRGEGRRGQANGFKPKRLKTRVGELALSVPQVRGAKFYPTALERGSRSEKALRLALAESYVQGVSTSKVTKITEELCGCEISSSDVSRATALLDEDLQKWRSRPLDQVKYLILDARYEKVRHAGSVRDCAVLTAIGVDAEGRRSVLGALRSGSPLAGVLQEPLGPRPAWRRADHQRRSCGPGGGPQGVLRRRAVAALPIPSHAQCAGPRSARGDETRSPRRSGERARLGRRVRAAEQLSRVVGKYETTAPKLAAWIEENVPQSFAVFRLPAAHRVRLRTTNMLERVHRELKRRTRVATLFPNDASLLRLVTAVLMELSEEWETGKRYVTFETK
jgi:putative transposase